MPRRCLPLVTRDSEATATGTGWGWPTAEGLIRQKAGGSKQSALDGVAAGTGIRMALRQMRQDTQREAFAKLNSLLIEGIDAPDQALIRHLVLVHCEQSSHHPRR